MTDHEKYAARGAALRSFGGGYLDFEIIEVLTVIDSHRSRTDPIMIARTSPIWGRACGPIGVPHLLHTDWWGSDARNGPKLSNCSQPGDTPERRNVLCVYAEGNIGYRACVMWACSHAERHIGQTCSKEMYQKNMRRVDHMTVLSCVLRK